MDLHELSGDQKLFIMPFQQNDIHLHGHNFFELAYVTGGSAVQNLDGKKERVQEGDYFIIDYNALHSYQECDHFTLINCLFLPEVIDETLEGCRSLEEMLRICMIRYYQKAFAQEKTANRIFHDTDGRVRALLAGIQQEFETKGFGWKEIFCSRLKEILILMMRNAISKDQGTISLERKEMDDMISDLAAYLKKHYTEHCVLSNYCEEKHYCLSYISRRFRQETGLTALQYLQKIRIDQSCALLASGKKSVTQAALEVGYEDTKYFSKIFRRMLGISPGAYRRMTVND